MQRQKTKSSLDLLQTPFLVTFWASAFGAQLASRVVATCAPALRGERLLLERKVPQKCFSSVLRALKIL